MLPDALRAIASQHQCRFQIVEQMSKRSRFREHWNEAGHRGTPQTGGRTLQKDRRLAVICRNHVQLDCALLWTSDIHVVVTNIRAKQAVLAATR